MMAAALIAASCTDFDDYNEAYQTGGAGSNKTLWENISERENLSDFARLLSKGGYDKELSKSRFYTVWAPENGTFNFDEFNQMDSATLVQRFIKSNVADYNFVLSSSVDERVHVLNEKSFTLQNLEGCTFGGNDIVTSNIPSLNGTLHITDGAVQYMPNIYEYIFDNADTDSSIAQYLKKYEDVYLDEKNSVVGPIDSLGQQTYSDSVMVMRNVIMEQMRAKRNVAEAVFKKFTEAKDKFDTYAFCFFEGEDGKYYNSRIEKYWGGNFIPLVAGNKKEVLKVMRMIKASPLYNTVCTMFFVDRDYDKSLKGTDKDLFETPCYSIENLYAQETTFCRILQAEFGLSIIDSDYCKCLETYRARLAEFNQIIFQ